MLTATVILVNSGVDLLLLSCCERRVCPDMHISGVCVCVWHSY